MVEPGAFCLPVVGVAWAVGVQYLDLRRVASITFQAVGKTKTSRPNLLFASYSTTVLSKRMKQLGSWRIGILDAILRGR